jgi:hypothetical protein
VTLDSDVAVQNSGLSPWRTSSSARSAREPRTRQLRSREGRRRAGPGRRLIIPSTRGAHLEASMPRARSELARPAVWQATAQAAAEALREPPPRVGGGRYFIYRPLLGPWQPSDRACTVQIREQWPPDLVVFSAWTAWIARRREHGEASGDPARCRKAPGSLALAAAPFSGTAERVLPRPRAPLSNVPGERRRRHGLSCCRRNDRARGEQGRP